MKQRRFFITAKTDTPLLELLTGNLPAQHIPETVISSGGVWLNKKRIIKPGFIIRKQETIKVNVCDSQGKIYSLPQQHIIFENNDLLVVYKPCNLNVHGVPTSFKYDLTYGVNTYLKQKGIHFESTPVTRLDRPVEGLVIFAKNKSTERKLFAMGKDRKIRKWYMAALEKGEKINPQCVRIRDVIASDGVRTLLNPEGKAADSLFVKRGELDHERKHEEEVIESNQHDCSDCRHESCCDIYSVFIFTGRRHQIRFHASHYIAPIIGDGFYGSNVSLPPDEIALMCRGYNIPYHGKILRVRLPESFIQSFYRKISKKEDTSPR